MHMQNIIHHIFFQMAPVAEPLVLCNSVEISLVVGRDSCLGQRHWWMLGNQKPRIWVRVPRIWVDVRCEGV